MFKNCHYINNNFVLRLFHYFVVVILNSAAETYVKCAKDCTPSDGRSAVEQLAETARTATCGMYTKS